MLVFGISWCHFGHDVSAATRILKMDPTAHLGLSGSLLLLILAFKLSMVSPREFNQHNAGLFQILLEEIQKKTTNIVWMFFQPWLNYWVLNYQPVRLIGFIPINSSISSIIILWLCAPQNFPSGFESKKREAKEANPVLGLGKTSHP